MEPKNKSWGTRFRNGLTDLIRWFVPGLGVKRWLLLVLLGTSLIGAGLAVIVLEVYRESPDTWWLPALSWLSLRFLVRPLRALILSHYRRRGRGPRIATIGGGHGLAILLRGLKNYTHNLTAVVTVADDGGSSGRLRDSMGILPPGDIRNCLAALSSDETLITQLFQYRFAGGNGDLGGHSFGNLFISALSEITGSFEEAVAESGRVLSVHGRVLPSTLHNVRLVADLTLPHQMREVRVKGESHIPQISGDVRRVWLEPDNQPAFPEAIKALLAADLIVLGPGSLYTSILPNLLVRDISAAIRASSALKIYVCNVATQIGETEGYSCGDHIKAIEAHVGPGIFDIVVSNQYCEGALPEGVSWVLAEEGLEEEYALYQADIADHQLPGQHDATGLAQVLIDILQERTGPLEM
jgi:uncharacterized cofD-like protein